MPDIKRAVHGREFLAARRAANLSSSIDQRSDGRSARPIELVAADSITLAPIAWLWTGFLARGKLHVLAGVAGTGKTTLALSLAAVVSRGGQWPDGTESAPGNVLIWSGEDGVDDVLVPRLVVAGANLPRVRFVGGHRHGSGQEFDPSTDFPGLSDVVATFKPSLILIDPIVSAVRGDSHKNTEVRRGLQPVVDFAERNGCAVLGITHFSKGTQGLPTIDRVTGSLAFGAVPRIVWATGNLSESRGGGLVLVRIKNNIGPDGDGFAFELEQAEVPNYPGVVAPRVNWKGAVAGTAAEILAQEASREDRDEGSARHLVRQMLADGPRLAADIFREGEALGHNKWTLQRAGKRLRVRSRKCAMAGGWEWSLPEHDNSKGGHANSAEASPSSPSASSKMTDSPEDDVDDIKSCCESSSHSRTPVNESPSG